jgi:hypothetical protein
MSAAETEEEAPPPQKKSIFACLTNLPGVCVPQKGAEPNADEPTPKSKSPTSVASKFAALSPYNRKRKQEEQAAKEHEETRLRDQFRRVDTDHSGKVDRHELKFLLNRVTGSTPTEDELDEMMDGVDTSGDGLIDFEEFRGIHQKAKSGERPVWKSTSELGYPEKYCVDLREPPRHRADVATGTTSRRWRGIATPSRRRSYGKHVASMAWGARNLISTQANCDSRNYQGY